MVAIARYQRRLFNFIFCGGKGPEAWACVLQEAERIRPTATFCRLGFMPLDPWIAFLFSIIQMRIVLATLRLTKSSINITLRIKSGLLSLQNWLK